MTDEKANTMRRTGTVAATLLAGAMMGGGAVALQSDSLTYRHMQFTCNRIGKCEADFEVVQDGKSIGVKTVHFGVVNPNDKTAVPMEKLPDELKACVSAVSSGALVKIATP